MIGNSFTVQLTEIQCSECSVWYGLDSRQYARLLEQGGNFYCPNGHGQQFTTPEVAKLKQRVQSLESYSKMVESNLQSEKYSHAATKGKLTKTKNRIAHGVCPCCNRSFQNVMRHMAGQHPNYVTTD